MAEFPAQLPPMPAVAYTSRDRYASYYSRSDSMKKSGQPWDLFVSWGQLRPKIDAEGRITSHRLSKSFSTRAPPIPFLPSNPTDEEFSDGLLKPVQIRRKMAAMQQKIRERIVNARNSRLNYARDVREIDNLAKKFSKCLWSTTLTEDDQPPVTRTPPSRMVKMKKQSYTESADGLMETSDEEFDPSKNADNDSSEDSDTDTEIHLNVESVGSFLDSPQVARVMMDFHKESRFLVDDVIPIVPDEYLGGCLDTLDTEDRKIIHASGPRMDEISIRQYSAAGEVVPQGEIVSQHHFTETVKQITCQEFTSHEALVAARGSSQICFYSCDGTNLSALDLSSIQGVQHISINPYYPSAVYVHNNEIYQWNPQTKTQKVDYDWSTRFAVRQDTRTVHYGSHPLHLVLTDPTVCMTYDLRTQAEGTILYEIPSNTLLHSDERLITSTQASIFQHHILAHHTLLTIDERFTKYPLVYQVLPCLTWPMLMHAHKLTSTQNLLFIGCPTNRELFCMLADMGGDGVNTTPIWKCGQVGDIASVHQTQPHMNQKACVDNRLDTGILGVNGFSRSPEQFDVLQLTGPGDLFKQTYNISDQLSLNGTQCDLNNIDAEVKQRCSDWYCSLQARHENLYRPSDASKTLNIPNMTVPSHQCCNVCQGRQSQVVVAGLNDSERCFCCNLTLSQSSLLTNSVSQDKVVTFDEDENIPLPDKLLKFDPHKYTDGNSELLTKLWFGDQITEALVKRDKEWEARRAEVAAEIAKKKKLEMSLNANSSISEMDTMSLKSGQSLNSSPLPGFSNAPRRIKSKQSSIRSDSDAESLFSVHQSLEMLRDISFPVKKKKAKGTKGF